jgi:prolyl oligopeptidase
MGGKYYFHTRREGNQNQPILYVRDGLNAEDRVLLDVNKLVRRRHGCARLVVRGRRRQVRCLRNVASGSEESTLHIIESATGKLLPDSIDRTRFASVAWTKDSSAFYYTRHPRKGEVPDGEEVYHSKVFYHQIGSDPVKDPLIFGEGRNPQDTPNVTLSEDDRWLLIDVGEGWTKTEMYLQDLQSKNPPVEITSGKDFLYGADFLQGKTLHHDQ